jgi:hypothetical protein
MQKRRVSNHNDKYVLFYTFEDESAESDHEDGDRER